MHGRVETRPMPARARPRAPGKLAVAGLVCFVAAGLGGAVTRPRIDGWYRTIEKPAFNPPDWVFGPVWTVLFVIMAVVLWQIWRTPAAEGRERTQKRTALTAFGVQLVLNVGWSAVFFGLTSIAGGMFVVVLLFGSVLWTILAARPVIGAAAWWLAPYLAWVGFAGVLNASILALNA